MSKTTQNFVLALLTLCLILFMQSLVIQAAPPDTLQLGITPTPTSPPTPTPSPTAIPTPNEIPEPGTLFLLGGGLMALGLGISRRKAKAP